MNPEASCKLRVQGWTNWFVPKGSGRRERKGTRPRVGDRGWLGDKAQRALIVFGVNSRRHRDAKQTPQTSEIALA